MVLGLPILLLLVGLVVWVIVRATRSEGSSPASEGPAPGAGTVLLEERLAAWEASGLLSPGQAAAIREHEQRLAALPPPPSPGATPAEPRSAVPVVAEALGYLGAALVATGVALVVVRTWADLTTAARLGLVGGVAVLTLVGGALVPEARDPALARLRGVAWTVATAAAGFFAGLVLVDALDVTAPETVTLAVAGVVALESGALWWWRDRPLQQLACLGALPVAAAAATAHLVAGTSWPGAAAWLVGVVLVGAGVRNLTPSPVVTDLVGALAAAAGATMVAFEAPGAGLPLGVVTALGLVALALVPGLARRRSDQLVVGIVGTLALWEAAPGAIGYFSADAGAVTGLITWAVGVTLVAAGVSRRVRLSALVEAAGAVVALGGAALVGAQWPGVAPLAGIATAVALIVLGTRPDQVEASILGTLGLLVNVPWAIARWFPGEGRVPLLILVSGALVLGLAVLLTRRAGDGHHPHHPGLPGVT